MTKQETYEYLTERGIDFEVVEHPAVFNMAEVAKIQLPHPEADAKNLFIGVHPNDNTATIFLKTQDLINIIADHGNKVSVEEIGSKF